MQIHEVTNRAQFPQMIDTYDCTAGVEIGVATGTFSEFILEHSYIAVLYSIDPWIVARNKDQKAMTKSKLGDEKIAETARKLDRFKHRSIMIRAESVLMANMFPDGYFDFIHIDGAHRYEYVKQDIAAYWPKVRPGGLFTGHDYYERHGGDVKRAVDEFIEETGEHLFVTKDRRLPCWMVLKGGS